ncbi:uncharacterized protein LOC128680401 [Plodia interpunctella]|uniref:uncharacterized protein LOC128680401 n=1 Tax=Plodia interpunctella TaxID=58824 RepID=UPI0023688AC9|nr:uncharacterized protein LOC128680401 [Plodia interpunctella]
MGQEDNLHASLAHIVLCCVAGNGISGWSSGKSFTHPGMHTNFLIHGILGILNFQSGTFGDIAPAYGLSMKATKYLPLACLMADMYKRDPLNTNDTLSMVHLFSGLIPFALAVIGKDNKELGHLVVAANVIGLGIWSVQNGREWGYYTTAAAILAYLSPHVGTPVLYPLTLAFMEYCAIRMYSWVPPQNRRR